MYKPSRELIIPAVVIFIFLLCSCIGVEMQVELNKDNSGRITLDYSVMRALIHLGTIDEERPFYTIPISREDFDRVVAAIDGLDLRSFKMEEDSAEVHVSAKIDFDSVDALSELFQSTGPGAIEITSSDERTVYRHQIFSGNHVELDPDSKKMIETFFKDYHIQYTLSTPLSVVATSHGEFSDKTATAVFNVADVTIATDPVVWEVSW